MFLSKSSRLTSDKVLVIPNGYDADDFDFSNRTSDGPFTISYVGTLAESYRPDRFIEVLNRFSAMHPKEEIRFRFVGNIPWNIRELFEREARGWNVIWTGHVPHLEATKAMVQADVLLLVIPDVSGAEGILTGKLFEYIGSGTRVLGMGPVNGEASRILSECNAGLMYNRDDIDGMVSFLNSAFISRNKKPDSVQENSAFQYSRRSLTEKLAQLIINPLNS
jgi:glycosyltransferase involved in cell wall biosynthesis